VTLAARAVTLVLGLGLVGCEKAPPAPKAAQSASLEDHGAAPEHARRAVRWFGTLRSIMHEGRTQSAVKLADVVPGPHVWGVGALEGLHGEATLLDDVVWLARPKADGSAELSRADLDGVDAAQGAALLVVANVDAWAETVVPNEVPWSQLDSFIENELAMRGVALDVPVAVRIDGPVAMLKWHVVDGSKLAAGAGHAEHARTAVRGAVDRADARLVGFFSKSHQGVFTHAGSRTHFHVLIESQRVSGHVDTMALQPGARLLIATK
jgi:hypothetical protein